MSTPLPPKTACPSPENAGTPFLPPSLMTMAIRNGRMRVRARGLRNPLSDDIYHRLMRLPWWRLLALFIGVFLTFNLLFATLYDVDPAGLVDSAPPAPMPHFWRCFFFSVHTVATVGYGNIYPASVYVNVVVVFEIIVGIVYFALTTGIAFARFSRPTARLLFSRPMVVREVDGVPTLMVRAANRRHNMMYSAEARLSLLTDNMMSGTRMRRFVDLRLVRSSNPAFALTWMIMHPIDEDSPLRPWLESGCAPDGAELVIIVSGTDEVSGQLIHGYWAYGAADIRWNAQFMDILSVEPDGARTIDYGRFHEVAALD